MKVKREEVSRLSSALTSSSLMTMVSTKGLIFFPIESVEAAEETETGVILLEARKDGSASLVKPGIVLSIGEKEEVPTVMLAYASVEYAAPFSVKEYHEITKDEGFLQKEELDFLSGLDCLLIRKESVLAAFELGAEIRLSDR